MDRLREHHWSDLVGSPWELGGADPDTGIDCWELVRLVCGRRGIAVPKIEPGDYQSRQAIGAPDLSGWTEIPAAEKRPGDVAAYSLSGRVVDHVGVYVGSGRVLHSRADSGVVALPESASSGRLLSWWRPGPPTSPSVMTGHDSDRASESIGDRSSGVVIVRVYESILNTSRYTTHVCEWTGGVAAEYLPIEIPVAEVCASINGGTITRTQIHEHIPQQGDCLNVVQVPAGPAIIVAVGGFASAAAAEAVLGTVGFALLSFAVTTIISVGLSFLSSLLLAPPKPATDQSPVDDSPTFSQAGIRNTIAAGGVIPIVIGTHRVGGQIIGSYNSIGGLVVTPFAPTGPFPTPGPPPSPTNPGGPYDLIQNTNAASASGGKTTLNLLIAVSEGEIEAINGINGAVNDMPTTTLPTGTLLIDGNDAKDYAGVLISTRMGTTDQTIIPGFSDNVTAVGVERVLRYQQPYTTTTTTDVTAFALQLFEPSGHFRIAASDSSTRQKTVLYEFRYRPAGATTWTATHTITRGYINRAAHSWEIKVQSLLKGKWEIYLERMTHDDDDPLWQSGGSSNPQEVSTSLVNAVNEIIEGGVAHSGLALIAIKAVATDQLSGVPTATSIVKGKKWWVWDGVSTTDPRFTFQWTDNPGEVLQGLMTNKIFGLGNYINLSRIRLADLKAVADYCNESIDDGRGGMMDRWRCNMVYDVSRKGGDLMDQILATCRTSMVIVGGDYGFKIDKTRSVTHLFSEGNVSDVKIGHVDVTGRPSRINVQFANEELDYDIDTVSVEDATVSDADFVEDTVTLLGVTKPARAMRFAQHRLNLSRTPLKTLEFVGSSTAITLSPGDLFWFAHKELKTTQASGLLINAGSLSVNLDRDVVIDNTKTYKIRIMWYKSSTATREIQEFTLSTPTSGTIAAGTGISWSSAIALPANIPTPGAVYAFGESADYVTSFIAVASPMNSELQRTVQAIEYDATIYDDDPGDVPTATDILHDRKLAPPAVDGLTLYESARTNHSGDIRHVIVASWRATFAFEGADVYYRWHDDEFTSWTILGRFSGQSAEIDTHGRRDLIYVSVVPVSPIGNSRGPESGTVQHKMIFGKLTRPDDISGLTAYDIESGVLLSWDEPDDRDIGHYEIRHGTTWAMGRILDCIPAPTCSAKLMRDISQGYSGSAKFMLKAVNTSGRESLNHAEIAIAPIARDAETVTQTEESSWSGTDTNMTISGSVIESDVSTTCGYTTAAIDTGSISNQYVTAVLDAHIEDRTAPTVDDFTWMVESAGARERTVAPSALVDYPEDLSDWAHGPVSALAMPVSDLHYGLIGPDPRTDYGLTLKLRVADTSGGLAAASWKTLNQQIQSFRWYQVRVSARVPLESYKVVYTGLTTAAYTALS